jgi:putative drug exporter of the RND superfamily
MILIAFLPLVAKLVGNGSGSGGMLRQLAAFTVRRPKVVLGAVLVLLGISIVFGGTVSDKLGVGGYTDPASESSQADEFLDKNFGTTSNLVIQVLSGEGTVDSPDVATVEHQVRQLVEAQPDAKVTRSFADNQATDLRSRDGRSGLILVHVGGTADEAASAASRIIASLPDVHTQNVSVRAGGSLGVQQEIRDKVKHDLKISEAIALPVSLAVLVIVFGGLIAAFLPVVVGITSIVTTLLVLLLMTKVTDVSVHALTVATAFGLGLSIDFGLLMVSRFREERDNGKDHQQAIIATVTTAGRTIIFSAATVTLAMTGLLVFPTYFLRSVGITATAVVILSAFSAIVVLPALLALLGKRIDSLAVIRRKVPLSADSLFWRRFAQAVTRRPLWYALPVVAVLLGLGIPFLSAQFATPDERALPSDSNARLVSESLRHDFPLDPSQAITLVTRNDTGALKDLAAQISRMNDVVLVDGPIGEYQHGQQIADPRPASAQSSASYAFVYLSVEAESDAAQQLVHDIRAKINDHQVEVGGPTATLIDSRDAVADRLPLAIALIAVFTFMLLFLFTGSIIVPIKALVLNLLVLSAVLGAMVWIFQNGHLASILGITPAPLNLSMVVLLCSIAFSLSVDYEIFLLSRIKEARDSGLSNNDAVVVGLGRVGRIITSAAILLTITLVSFANGLSFMKMFGIGTALAVVIDATIIRGVVVPAFLRVAGELNWWAPRPLKRLHARIGFSEAPSAAPATTPVPQAPEETPHQPAVQIAEDHNVVCHGPASPAREVEVIPGRHLVANVNGTVIVVAHRDRAPLSRQSVAAQQLAALAEIVRRTDAQMLASAFSQLTHQKTWSQALVDVGIVMPTPTGLDIFLCGGVTVALDNGAGRTLLHGRGSVLHRSVSVPAVAAVVTVDEVGQRPLAPPDRNGVYTLTGGTVPGQGAIVWSTQAASAPRRAPAPSAPAHIDRLSAAPTVQLARPKRWVVLDDDSRFEIDRDCVIGRDPHNSNAAKRGLRPVRIDDRTGEMSRAHIEIRFVNGEVVIVDRNSTNGVLVREPAQDGWTRLAPWEPAKWLPGAYVRIGSRTLQLQVLSAPRPQRHPHVNVRHDIPKQAHAGPAYAAAIAE